MLQVQVHPHPWLATRHDPIIYEHKRTTQIPKVLRRLRRRFRTRPHPLLATWPAPFLCTCTPTQPNTQDTAATTAVIPSPTTSTAGNFASTTREWHVHVADAKVLQLQIRGHLLATLPANGLFRKQRLFIDRDTTKVSCRI